MDDYPVTLLPPVGAIRSPAPSRVAAEHAWMKNVEVLAAPSPGRRKWPAAVTATVLAGAVAAGIYWTQLREAAAPDSNSQAQLPAAASTPTQDPAVTASDTPAEGGGLPSLQEGSRRFESSDSPASGETDQSTATTEQVDPTATDALGASISTTTAVEDETLVDIAERANVEVSSLVWSNPGFGPTEPLEVGTTVYIPEDGTLIHTVVANDTHESIAAAYGVDVDDLYDSDGHPLPVSADLFPGETIVVDSATQIDRGSVDHYTVETGDNLWTIASYYGLQPQTLAWANELPRPELIHPDQDLIIPPGDGALVVAEAGDSVETLIEPFEADYDAVVDYAFNDLSSNSVLQEGQWVLIPGDLFAPLASGPTELNASSVSGSDEVSSATGEFIWPTDGTVTQEFGGRHNGLDIANEEWTPINAADGGIVIFAGWNDYGLGYAVGIDHGNGYVSWYGHMAQQPYVEVGQVIWQGGYIGPMGTTGNSTGPHLHFIIMNDGVYQNPLPLIQ